MQQSWGRHFDFVDLEEGRFASMVRPAFGEKRITSRELLTAGLCNTNYKFTIEGLDEAFVLRIYVRDRQAAEKDYAILKLVQPDVPVPEALYLEEGDEATPAYIIMKWVDGILLSDVLATRDTNAIAACAYDCGRVLTRIGRHTFPQAGFFGPGLSIAYPFSDNDDTSFLSLIEQFLFKGQAGERLGTELSQQLWQHAERNQSYLALTEGDAALVHSDFKGFNILVRPEQGCVSAVLDWEFAFAGSPLTDIANMLRYEHIHPPALAREFTRGYREHGGRLPEGWQRAAKMVDLLSLCEFLNRPSSNNTLIEEVTGLITHTLHNWEKFA